MYLGILQDLGLTLNEAKIYQTLVEAGELNVAALSSQAKIHRRNVYDNLNRLMEKGLVFQILEHGDNLYQAANPDYLLNLVKQKESKLKKILPDLQKQYRHQPHYQQVHIYRGLDGLQAYWSDLIQSAQQVYAINPPFLSAHPALNHLTNKFFQQAQRAGLTYECLLNNDFKKQLTLIQPSFVRAYKTLPDANNHQPSLEILSDRLVNISGLTTDNKNLIDLVIYIIIDPTLAKSYLTWFKNSWQQLPSTQSASQPSPQSQSQPGTKIT